MTPQRVGLTATVDPFNGWCDFPSEGASTSAVAVISYRMGETLFNGCVDRLVGRGKTTVGWVGLLDGRVNDSLVVVIVLLSEVTALLAAVNPLSGWGD